MELKLSGVTVSLCRLDLNDPKELNLKIDLASNHPLQCFCSLNAGEKSPWVNRIPTSTRFSSRCFLFCKVEVPVSGMVVYFLTVRTYRGKPTSPIFQVTGDLGLLIQQEHPRINSECQTMIKNLGFNMYTFKQNCCLAEVNHSVLNMYWAG